MSHIFIDDSIHDNAEFIIASCVYSRIDLTQIISEILIQSGYDPELSEFKSSINYNKEPQMADVREAMKGLLNGNCRFGLVVIPRNERENLGFECLNGLNQFIKVNNLKERLDIYFDQNLFPSLNKANQFAQCLNLTNCNFHFEQNSIQIKGLQLADLAAHTCSIMLKEKMGLINKTVKAGKNSGYEEDLDIEIGFELWASIRYNFFHEGSKPYIDDPIVDATLKVDPFGLYISPKCDIKLTEYAKRAFESVYLGCIH